MLLSAFSAADFLLRYSEILPGCVLRSQYQDFRFLLFWSSRTAYLRVFEVHSLHLPPLFFCKLYCLHFVLIFILFIFWHSFSSIFSVSILLLWGWSAKFYYNTSIKDIATLEMMTENGVKKAKEKAIEHFWELFPRSNFSVWINVFHRVRLQIKYPDNEYWVL